MRAGRVSMPQEIVIGRWRYLYWAIDQYGQVIDVLLSDKRDLAAPAGFSRGSSMALS